MTKAQWLEDFTGHGIYSHEMAAKEFKDLFGDDAPWKPQLAYTLLGGMKGATYQDGVDPNEKVIGGYEIAESVAAKYAHYANAFLSGRGSRFRAAIEALKQAGV